MINYLQGRKERQDGQEVRAVWDAHGNVSVSLAAQYTGPVVTIERESGSNLFY